MKLIIPDRDTLRRKHGKWRDVVTVAASEITAVVYCSHGSDHDCAYRKPQPGLLQDFTPSPGCA